ncbi:MAG: apolipoprotein N-acyltransferase [gamma proteobacterium symbiont of Lucinoma myriamae]|nr:apolipoprotein N-acyltransferase [gamma proteobacterium symbiont of Lucinoma myriamae]
MSQFIANTTAYKAGNKSLVELLPESLRKWLTKGISAWFIVFLSGALVPVAFAPFNTRASLFSYLIFLPLVLFLYQLLHTRTGKEAFYKGAVFGIGLFSVGVSWLYVAIHDFGAAHWSLAGFFTGGFILLLSSFYAFFAWSVFKIRQSKSIPQTYLSLFYLPVLWVFFEWLRSWLLTGFPWILLGYPLIETPFAGFAPIMGIYGLSLLAAFSAALLIARIKPAISLISIGLLFSSGWLWSQIQWSEPQGKPLSVALIQGNVNQTVKWDRWQLEKTKQLYISLSQDQWQSNDLIVWPENAIPVFYHTLESGFYHNLTLQAEKTQTELITGLPVFDDKTQQYYNSMTNFGGQQGYYYKTHLVPFGEYVPLASLIRGIIQFFNMPMSAFSAGEADQPPLIIKGYKAVVTLCYEDVFPQDMMTHIPQSQFMINLSNNGWYGDSFAPHQHLEMARMRALETSRELIRSTTSGISAIIDSKGKVRVKGPQFKRAVINGKVQPRTGTTPYVFWGNYPIVLLFIVTFLFLKRAPSRILNQ